MNLSEIIQIAANVAVAGSFLFLAWQTYLSRLERRHDIYERVNTEWIQHMSRILDDPELEKIWEALEESQIRRFEKAMKESGDSGAAWSVMTITEKKCYRYIRVALEIFEVAYQTRMSGVKIPDQLIGKWDNQIRVFLTCDYFDYVFEDTRERLDDRFVGHIEDLKKEPDYLKHRFAKKGIMPNKTTEDGHSASLGTP
jgi:hypothetical protein